MLHGAKLNSHYMSRAVAKTDNVVIYYHSRMSSEIILFTLFLFVKNFNVKMFWRLLLSIKHTITYSVQEFRLKQCVKDANI